jgi:hypothetical protein
MQAELTGGSSSASPLANGFAMMSRGASVIWLRDASAMDVPVINGRDGRIRSVCVGDVAPPGRGSSNTKARASRYRNGMFSQPVMRDAAASDHRSGRSDQSSAVVQVESDSRVREHEQLTGVQRARTLADPW